jgi:hypothetical protein
MVVGVGFCKIKVDSNFLLVLKIKCTKFHQDRSKTVDLHTKHTNKHSVLYIYIYMYILKKYTSKGRTHYRQPTIRRRQIYYRITRKFNAKLSS